MCDGEFSIMSQNGIYSRKFKDRVVSQSIKEDLPFEFNGTLVDIILETSPTRIICNSDEKTEDVFNIFNN